MKYKGKTGNFNQTDRRIHRCNASPGAKTLHSVLTDLEHRFTSGWDSKDYFWRTAQDLAKDCGWTSVNTVRKYRRELEKKGLIETWVMHPPADGSKNGGGPYKKGAVIAFRLKQNTDLTPTD